LKDSFDSDEEFNSSSDSDSLSESSVAEGKFPKTTFTLFPYKWKEVKRVALVTSDYPSSRRKKAFQPIRMRALPAKFVKEANYLYKSLGLGRSIHNVIELRACRAALRVCEEIHGFCGLITKLISSVNIISIRELKLIAFRSPVRSVLNTNRNYTGTKDYPLWVRRALLRAFDAISSQ